MDNDPKHENPIVALNHTDDYFVELCALASTGTLSSAEWRQLETHLSQCASCRAIKAEYGQIISTTLPSMAANEANADDGDPSDGWSLESAERALFERINREDIKQDKLTNSPQISAGGRLPWVGAAAAVFILGCSYAAYRVGEIRGRDAFIALHPSQGATAPAPAQTLKAAQVPPTSIYHVDHEAVARLSEMQHRLQTSEAEARALEAQRQSLLDALSQRDSELKESDGQRTDLEQRLSEAQASTQALQAQFDLTVVQPSVKASLKALQQRMNDLTAELGDKDQQIAKQEELLEHDRDIRNLMGARDLYIGEIYDVAKSGKTQKPFGRVFYTKGKSLVFYAYDLDQQPGVKLASTFQAWGRRGVDQLHDVSLGIFFQDDQNKKRWILKSNDSNTLSQLDAVFVTVEPHGVSDKPTGKPLLFTYLRLTPNHP